MVRMIIKLWTYTKQNRGGRWYIQKGGGGRQGIKKTNKIK
jgi:hypothetical protein